MVNFTILQVVLLTLLAFIKHVDYYGIPMIFVNYAVFWGLITGVVMGCLLYTSPSPRDTR